MVKEGVQIVHGLEEISPGALAANTAVVSDLKIDGNLKNGFRIRKFKAWVEMSLFTQEDRPIEVGINMGLDATNTKEAIEADPQRINAPGESEEGNRPLYPLAMMYLNNTQKLASNGPVYLQEYKDFPKWHVQEEVALKMYLYNWSSSALTAGGIAHIRYLIIGRWERD